MQTSGDLDVEAVEPHELALPGLRSTGVRRRRVFRGSHAASGRQEGLVSVVWGPGGPLWTELWPCPTLLHAGTPL